jgi:hypothetical protein
MISADILLIVKTLAIVFLTGFFCVALMYSILILRRIHRALSATEERIGTLFDSWREFYSRLLGLRTSLDVIASGCKAVLSLYQRRMAQDDDEENEEEDEKKEKKIKRGRNKNDA